MFAKIKTKTKVAWRRIKLWVAGILASIGIGIGVGYADVKDFTWELPTEYEDGTPLAASDITETRVYCDGDTSPTITTAAPASAASADFGIGSHTCFATVVDVFGTESLPSNSVTFVVTPGRPNPPVLSVSQ